MPKPDVLVPVEVFVKVGYTTIAYTDDQPRVLEVLRLIWRAKSLDDIKELLDKTLVKFEDAAQAHKTREAEKPPEPMAVAPEPEKA